MDDSAELVTVWNRVRPRFDDPTIRPQQKAWIGLTRPLGLVEDTALLAAPNDFAKDYLENRLRPLIASVLSEELGRDIRVAVTVQSPDEQPDAGEFDLADEEDWVADQPLPLTSLPSYRPKHADDERDKASRLNPKYTFDTFVIGASNRFTHAAAVAVAEAPARAYNPLFIYGDSGLGKTHLLHAIGHYARRLQPGLRTRYISSEEFTNDFINSVRDDKMQAFQSRYRSVDVLLIDDIQFLERAERTQEEFFHTFNT
ncbi:MAG: chromosomal replication initiator protein, partial [Pseudonocardiales bacterium]|nr:chromosomal replication initiator protein [Pseudonocardiales bacterium]